MGFSTFLKKLRGKQSKTPSPADWFTWQPTATSLKFVMSDEAHNNLEQLACNNKLFAMQLVNLNMLHEQGFAQKTEDGFEVPAEIITVLDQDFYKLFKLPAYFDGKFALDCHGLTYQPTFDVSLRVFKDCEIPGAHLEGPFLKVGSHTYYSLTEPQWSALKAVENFHSKPASSRSIFDNNLLIHTLKGAQQRDNNLHLNPQNKAPTQAQASAPSQLQTTALAQSQSQIPAQAQPQAMGQAPTQTGLRAQDGLAAQTQYQSGLPEMQGLPGMTAQAQALDEGQDLDELLVQDDKTQFLGSDDFDMDAWELAHELDQIPTLNNGDQTTPNRLGEDGRSHGGIGRIGGMGGIGRLSRTFAPKLSNMHGNHAVEGGGADLPSLNLNLAHFENLHTQQPESVSLAVEEDSEGNLNLSPVFAHCSPDDISRRLDNLTFDDEPAVLHVNDDIVLLKKNITHAVNQIRKYRRIPKKHVAQFLNSPTAFFQDPNIDLDCGFSLRVKGAESFMHKYFGEVEYKDNTWFTGIAAGFKPLLAVAPYIESEDDLQKLAQSVKDALKVGANTVDFADQTFSFDGAISPQDVLSKIRIKLLNSLSAGLNQEKASPIVIKIASNDEQLDYSTDATRLDGAYNTNFSTDNLLKTPFAHQVDGIKWILSRFEAGRSSKQGTGGGLLADDMGLGKTFMTLVAIEEILKRYDEPKPVLIVGPLSLLENWEKEIATTFKTSPFTDVVVLQSKRDLNLFKIRGAKRETLRKDTKTPAPGQATAQDNTSVLTNTLTTPLTNTQATTSDAGSIDASIANTISMNAVNAMDGTRASNANAEGIGATNAMGMGAGESVSDEADSQDADDSSFAEVKFALKVGSQFEPFQLDRPGRLVLASYETLRDYQFSLSRIDWAVVACDESQFLKNPNTLVTRAAKALKADFILMMTGTPVENTLADIWCLMDTAVPGLLGAWQDFRQEYISPINHATAEDQIKTKIAVGQKLRAAIGDCMLRRTKEDNLSGLPKKVVFSPVASDNENTVLMPDLGQMMEGAQLSRYDSIVRAVASSDQNTRNNLVLASLQGLKLTSIHPALMEHDIALPEINPLDSCKIKVLDHILDEIRQRDEKAIVFLISKKAQEFLSVYLQTKYKVPVRVINGDTKAVASSYSGGGTRAQLLADFQNRPGFGIIILSPIAVGVGLTIVGANNVIHMERHWNPAKEAQATDRVYRIGQKRQVNVYLPMALHPQTESFDEKLNTLLRNKIDLSSAVVTPHIVSQSELESLFSF